MKRINEKVKDIVEVRKFQSLRDFNEDPAATLAAYRFTDATADLMKKWLDRIVALQGGQGGAMALAGYRGVGKSHFLATLSAIVGHPDLRTKLGEEHVSAAAQGLLRRRYPCLKVRRGTRSTLIDEFKTAVAKSLELAEDEVPDRIFDLVALVRSRAGDVPFIVLVDTAAERTTRVARDDGATLSQLADTITGVGGFLGVALDDDIAGADGSNSGIVQSFTIDYLDQEHLFKIVDSYVFPKNPRFRPVLHDVYEYFREVMPTFRWSEQRFSSLYPLHPAILDVAPFVRLYVNDFALLSFTADAGERILGRPANSLIALDEVFDSAEADLRKVDELQEAFEAYDKLNSDVVAKIPVMQRLQAKLILKALLILSLEGQGTTAGEISSGTLIFDENDPKKANQTVEEIIRMFAAAMPDSVNVYSEEGREIRYGLRVSGSDGLKQALETAALSVAEDRVGETLQRLFAERYADSSFLAPDGSRRQAIEAGLTWRGGQRRGRIIWKASGSTADAELHDDHHDFEVLIDPSGADSPSDPSSNGLLKAIWRAGSLTPDDSDAIKRFWVIQNDLSIREQFSEQIRSAFHSHLLVLDRIVSRIFLEDGRIIIDGFDYNLSAEARSSTTLSGVFSVMLEPLFESRFPQHPYFLRNLGLAEVSSLVSDLYSGSRQKLGEVQQLAQTFALPLGLVRLADGVYYPANKEQLLALDLVKRIEAIISSSGDAATDLKLIYSELSKPPFGLVRESQQLILAAMVSQRMVEFVTSKGDRINHRSLDLRMIWDDIIGLARPHDSAYSAEKLAKWANHLTGRSDIGDISIDTEAAKFREGAEAWLSEWDMARVLGRFNDVPEEMLNTLIWKAVTRASRTVGATSSLIRKYLEGQSTAEECLGRVSELFQDEPERFQKANSDLETVRLYLDGFSERESAMKYLAVAGHSFDHGVESLREQAFAALSEFGRSLSPDANREVGYSFSRFASAFSEKYLEEHDSVMRSHDLQEKASEFFRSEDWWFYENVVGLVDDPSNSRVSLARDAVKRFDCTARTKDVLTGSPRCICGYESADRQKWESAVNELAVATGIATRKIVDHMRELLEPAASRIEDLVETAKDDPQLESCLKDVVRFVRTGTSPERWSGDHSRAFRLARTCVGPEERSDPNGEEAPLREADVDSAVLSLA